MNLPKSKRILVIDPSGAIYNPDCLKELVGFHFEIPTITISILSRIMSETKKEGLRYNSEKFLQNFSELIEGKKASEPIFYLKNSLRISKINGYHQKSSEDFNDKDEKNQILDICLGLKDQDKYKNVFLYTTDPAMKAKASFLGIEVFKGHEVSIRGFGPLPVLTLKKGFITEGSTNLEFYPKDVKEENLKKGCYYIIKTPKKDFLFRFLNGVLSQIFQPKNIFGISPKNIEQGAALHALLDPSITCVAVSGSTGSGKTLLSIAAALEQYSKESYQEIALSKPIIEVGNSIGFLPGTAQEKTEPHFGNFFDNISFIKNKADKNQKILIEKATKPKGPDNEQDLKIEIIQFLRGRSFMNRFYIIDECQNLTPHEIKTIITRAGEGTKVILLGDIAQIDTPFLDKRTNGLSHVVERFSGQDNFSHVHICETTRSLLAALADKLL